MQKKTEERRLLASLVADPASCAAFCRAFLHRDKDQAVWRKRLARDLSRVSRDLSRVSRESHLRPPLEGKSISRRVYFWKQRASADMSRDLGRAPVASLKTQSSSVLSTSANRSSSRVVQLCRWKATSNEAAVNVAQNAEQCIERRGCERTWARDKDQFAQNVSRAPAVRTHLSITMSPSSRHHPRQHACSCWPRPCSRRVCFRRACCCRRARTAAPRECCSYSAEKRRATWLQ